MNTLLNDLQGLTVITDPSTVTKLSQDYHTFSPILHPLLDQKRADMVVIPTNEEQVLQAAQACVRHRIPLTVRGAGTGNYGQCVPLHGGVVLDMSQMQTIRWLQPGRVRVEAGARLAAIDKQARDMGWELRMVPSTYRTATIGGFIGGGSGGIGSINYGQLRDRGNLHGVRVVTLEDTPRILELRGDDVQQVNHAYGTNGIMVELEVPLAPAIPWVELIVVFNDFPTAAHFGQSLGDADGLVKKLITILADPIPVYLTALRDFFPAGSHGALVMVAEFSLESFQELVRQWEGKITYQKSTGETNKGVSLVEYTWNHTTLHARSADASITYLQTIFPKDEELKLLLQLYDHFGNEVMMHLEFIRVGGAVVPAALQLVRFQTPERLLDIIEYHEKRGAFIANPHTYLLEDGGRKEIEPEQLQFKQKVDPYGLLNPGKMRSWNQTEG